MCHSEVKVEFIRYNPIKKISNNIIKKNIKIIIKIQKFFKNKIIIIIIK